MGSTITEKILANHVGRDSVTPGEIIMAKTDIVLANDITAPIAISEFKKTGIKKVFDNKKVVLVPDHFTPNKDIQSAAQVKILRDFAKEQDLTYFFETGRVGVEHALLPEQGIVVAGDLIIGADSHTCTYGALGAFSTGVGSTDVAYAMATGEVWLKVPESIKFIYHGSLGKWVTGKDLILYTIGDIGVDGALYKTMEFCGAVIEELPMHSRFTMCNMAIEAGGKSGIIAPDSISNHFLKYRAKRKYVFESSDPDAVYSGVKEYQVEDIEPQVAFPHLPENTRSIKDVGNIPVDQVIVGSCTNGWIEDLRAAAMVIKGKKVAPHVRMIVIPATPLIQMQAINEGLANIFMEAGAAFSTPTCGPCLGGHMGVLAKGERAIATTNRNFVGRMGDPESEVFLSNPYIAAASAVLGKIGSPDEL